MPNLDIAPRTLKGIPPRTQAGKPVAGILAVLTLACLGLSACGGSSGSSTKAATSAAAPTSATTSVSTSTSPGGSSTQAKGGAAGRFSAIRECLQKNGVTLPKGAGSGGPAGGIFLGAVGRAGGPQLPKGMTRQQFEAALKKCGGGNFGARFGRPGGVPGSRISSPAFRQTLAKFAVCLRQNGVNIPAPNTSGNGPLLSTKGINTTSPQFRAASAKCRGVLIGAFRSLRRPNGATGTGTGTGAAPPAGGQGSESSG
jgi:hypothetical protein